MALAERKYEEFVAGMVAEGKPRLFAVLHEFGDREDAEIAAWGMAWDSHVEVISLDGAARMRSQSPERALLLFGCDEEDSSSRLVWVDSDALS